jgi:hypothetical protein
MFLKWEVLKENIGLLIKEILQKKIKEKYFIFIIIITERNGDELTSVCTPSPSLSSLS